MSANYLPLPPLIDCHVHIVGNGQSGSGCWMRPTKAHFFLARFMAYHLGFSQNAFQGDLDAIYVSRILEMVQASSLEYAVILAHDLVYDESGTARPELGSFYVPNDYVLSLAQTHKEFLPAVSIHPARPDALEELDRCVEAGAVMMKCLPNCHNIDCNNEKYLPFWERMAHHKLLLLAHTGGEHTLPINAPEFANPRVLTLPLQCGVTVIAAHAGTKSGLTDPDYFSTFVEMLEEYPNLYGDNSALNSGPIRSRYLARASETAIVERILHGSDVPVPVHGHWALLRRMIDFKTFRQIQKIDNVLERDYLLKRAIGYPEGVFRRTATLLGITP